MKELDQNTFESVELVEQTFKYWFSDHNHIRSPFPNYIQSKLKKKSTKLFFTWISQLDPKAKDEINDEIIGERFEEIIFETAIGLVKTEDEQTTILYPFLPRIGDQIQNNTENDSKNESFIIDRTLVKEDDKSYLKIVLENATTKKNWETKFELPV
jgi:hypothetical protein